MKQRTETGDSRRDFLKKITVWTVSAAGILAAASLLRQFIPRISLHRKRIKIGGKNDFPVNAFTFQAEGQVFVFRDHEGIRAVSAICTHLGCIIEKSEEGFRCPCHGSCYDPEGRVVSGAAVQDLPWYEMHREPDGQIVVDKSIRVSPEQKLYL